MTLTAEWVEKAEEDYVIASSLNLRRKRPVPDGVCYHCQQCAEKYLKAFLVSKGVAPPRTHDLDVLLTLCLSYDATLAILLPAARALDPYSVRFRYPGASATEAEAKTAVLTLRQFRKIMRSKLRL